MQVYFSFGDLFGDVQHVMVLNIGNHNRINFDCDIMALELTDGLQLSIDQQLCSRGSMNIFTAKLYSGINTGTDKRIDGIGRNGDKSDAEFCEGGNMICQSESIGRQADMQQRISPADMFNRLKGSLQIGKGITGTGYTGDRKPWHLLDR